MLPQYLPIHYFLSLNQLLYAMSSELQSDVHSGGTRMLTGWRPVAVYWGSGVFAGCLPRVQLFVSTCNGQPHLVLQHHWLLPLNCHFD